MQYCNRRTHTHWVTGQMIATTYTAQWSHFAPTTIPPVCPSLPPFLPHILSVLDPPSLPSLALVIHLIRHSLPLCLSRVCVSVRVRVCHDPHLYLTFYQHVDGHNCKLFLKFILNAFVVLTSCPCHLTFYSVFYWLKYTVTYFVECRCRRVFVISVRKK